MEKCRMCGKRMNDNEVTFYNGKNIYFCPMCFRAFLEKEQLNDKRGFLYDTICRIFNLEELDGRMLKEIQRVLVRENISPSNLASVLHYIYDIKQIKVGTPTLFHVPDYIEESKQYYLNIQKREESLKKQLEIKKDKPKIITKPSYEYRNKKTPVLKINPDEV